MADFPPEIRGKIEADLREAIDSANGYPVVEEFMSTAIAMRYVFHTLTADGANTRPVPDAIAAQLVQQMMGSYLAMTGFAMAKKYQGIETQNFSVSTQ